MEQRNRFLLAYVTRVKQNFGYLVIKGFYTIYQSSKSIFIDRWEDIYCIYEVFPFTADYLIIWRQSDFELYHVSSYQMMSTPT
jgi:hypothetical protein